MVRSPEYLLTANPVHIVMKYARHYIHGPRKQYDHLSLYTSDKKAAERMLIFGGRIYRQRFKGWVWVCSKRKELLALERLMEAEEFPEVSDDMKRFQKRMHRRILRMHGK
jgi:hypothetical protein